MTQPLTKIETAFATIALREEGPIIRDWLFSKLIQAAPIGASLSALQDYEAERRFARTVLSMMGMNVADPRPEDAARITAELAAGRTAVRQQSAAVRSAGASRRAARRRSAPGTGET